VDAVDRDNLINNLIRPAGEMFLSLADIAKRHGVSKQAAAKRRARIEADLVGKGSRRGSDGDGWLSVLEHLPIVNVRRGARPDLSEQYEAAQQKFAGGTGYNLYWSGPSFQEAVDTSLKRAGITGTPESVYQMLTPGAVQALDDMRRCRDALGVPAVPTDPATGAALPSFISSTRKGYVDRRLRMSHFQYNERTWLEIGRVNTAEHPAFARRSQPSPTRATTNLDRGAFARPQRKPTSTQEDHR
jgi:hypothetical protein